VSGARALLLALLLSAPGVLAAQEVGTAPEHSPFQDILTHEGFTLFAGRFAGNPNDAHTGVRPGLMLAGRLNVRLSGALDISATFGEAFTSRLQINAGGDTARIMGNLKVRLLAADLGLQLNLTGDKTWHRLAPYVYIGGGITTPSAKVVDPGGFELGTNFDVVPALGTRLFVSRGLELQFEVRDYYYRYNFPLSYITVPYAGHPDYSPINSVLVGDHVWYNHLALWVGVTYGFNF
jgi:hypothetical protein